ncbi:MAG TPA: radical SAM protein [Polyangiaceae bacterium]|jgi:radical SAM protein with 4Fe4S-binding SPASM domain|nr:radical SAM protein [Polyangiaceae bacterium]
MIVRYEPWGAWVKLESTPAIVAIDRTRARSIGLDGGRRWTEAADRPSTPLEVHVAVTSRCGAGCKGCYLDAKPDGAEPPRADLESVLDALRDAGVFTVAFGGGEPTTRDDLGGLAEAARSRGITPVVTTSGLGLTDARVEGLRAFAQVNVSYDGDAATYEAVRGFDAARAAERAIATLASAGVRVGVNVVLTRSSFPRVLETLGRARSLGACEGQLLRYKPAGRAATLDYLAQRLTAEQVRSFPAVLRQASEALCADGGFHVRIDCALVPFLVTDASLIDDPTRLARFGVFGCEAGAGLAAVDAQGDVAPCSFAPPTSLRGLDLASGYAGDAALAGWRSWSEAPPEPCASCALRAVCKGGCKVVSRFLTGDHESDPECPRVIEARSRA